MITYRISHYFKLSNHPKNISTNNQENQKWALKIFKLYQRDGGRVIIT